MKLNKKEKNYLLSTLFKGYVIQCAICSVLIFGGTFLLGIMAEEILRKYVLYYYLYYRTVYLYIVAVIVWGGCIIYLTYLLLKKVVAYVYEVQAATGKMFDQNVSYIEMSPELSEIAANINQLKQEAESNARLAKENEQRKNDLIMYLAHDLKTPLSSVIGYLTLLRDESQISKELREKYLSITLGKAERLEDLINEFFEITRFNIYDITLQYTKINLTRLLEQLVYEFKPMLKSKNLQCNLCVDDDIMLRCDADKIQRVFDNLLRNAVIYSFENTDITISAQCQEDTVSITPTVSTQTTIVPAVPFIIFSPENGIFNTAVELEEKITAGQIIGTVNGKELKSPVDGTITSIAPSNESVPSNYPVAIVHYTGFALNVEADNFLSTLPEYAELKAKFQVYDGVGPTDMIAVVSPAADENAFTGIVPQEGILQCLISQTVDVKSGQSATVVITATTRNDVLILPLSVIAGRQGTGLVTVITPNGERVETKVTLGVTDGANIEILSGLEEGDVVSATPPNLDPRGI